MNENPPEPHSRSSGIHCTIVVDDGDVADAPDRVEIALPSARQSDVALALSMGIDTVG